MDDQKIQELINQFDTEKLKENAYFGIFQYGEGKDESYIKANKEGLLLYALQLILASEKIEKISVPNSIQKSVTFGVNDEWEKEKWIDEDSSRIIGYIEKFEVDHEKIIEKNNSNVFQKLIPIGCFLLFIIFGVSFFVGLAEIISWFE
ncbi:MAG: hypothetical protein RSF68_11810 [Myroides sp.]